MNVNKIALDKYIQILDNFLNNDITYERFENTFFSSRAKDSSWLNGELDGSLERILNELFLDICDIDFDVVENEQFKITYEEFLVKAKIIFHKLQTLLPLVSN